MSSALDLFTDVHAESFVRASEVLISRASQGLGTPGLICAALGAELSLKAILKRRGIEFGREHNLRVLLNLASPQDRDAIVTSTRLRFVDFDAELDKAARAFVDWRYIYESQAPKELNMLFLATLARSAAERLEAIRGQPLTLDVERVVI